MADPSAPIDEPSLAARLELGPGRPSTRRRWVLAALLVLALGLILWLFLNGADEAAGPAYSTRAATRAALSVTVSATGQLEPVNQVDVGTEVSGTIESVAVDFNDRVVEGQVLARLDTEELDAQVLQSRANLRVAQARVAQARATVDETRLQRDRCATLAARALCSQDLLDSAEATFLRSSSELSSAEAQVEAARATLGAQETRLRKAVIRAPIDGIVLDRQIEPGQTVAASLQTPVLFVLAEDLADMELHVDVDEADVGVVAAGQSATFTVDAYPERVFPARIRQVRFAPDAESGVVTYETVLAVDNEALLLRPGMTATAEIVVAEVDDALLVPNAALRFRPASDAEVPAASGSLLGRLFRGPPRRPRPEGAKDTGRSGSRSLWVLQDGAPVERAVTVGLTDGASTEVVAGALQEGDLVITGQSRPPAS
ncbi:MAG: efflux RND transporter periplasmic adaptor subunit [Pseudomonadales bacterium]|jgi:HlyD family secretion protein|nr:efflux RND transporter periplasmic adaptor subunit [Pseudomonadales bacterium]